MTLESQIADLVTAVTAQTETVNVKLTTLTQKVTDAAAQVTLATGQVVLASTQASNAAGSATAASTSSTASAGSAAQALMVYSSAAAMSAALASATNQSQLAQVAAASASSVLSQDLSAVSAALHRSPSAITAMCLYDTSKDSDGGAWVDRMQHTSWENEALSGAWLTGGFATELLARGDNLLTFSEQFDNAAWTPTNVTVTSNVAVAPDGATSADLVVATVVSGMHLIKASPVANQNTDIHSIYVKAAGCTKVGFKESTTTGVYAAFDLTTGTVASTNAAVSPTIQSKGNGWWLISMAVTTVNGAQALELRLLPANYTTGDLAGSYAGDGTSGVYLWGAKLNRVGELPSTYSASPELVSNGGFDNGTVGFAVSGSSTLSAAGNLLTVTNDGTGANAGIASQVIATVVGKVYSATCDFVKGTASNAGLSIGTSPGAASSGVSYGTVTGKMTVVFVAAATSVYVSVFNNVAAAGVTSQFDNISVKEVTTLATPYIPYSTQTNSYYQSSADGKFYKLGATFNTLTEVFRGNKAKFPRLAAIVAEATSVTIYALDQPGRPMWMRFMSDGSDSTSEFLPSSGTASLAMLNGALAVGATGAAAYYGHLRVANFLQDSMRKWAGYYNTNYLSPARLSQRNSTAVGFGPANDAYGVAPGIVDGRINAVAMTVLPDSPIDVTTGLQIPTIAVATAGGVSVIKQDGTVANSLGFAVNNVGFDSKNNAVTTGENSRNHRKILTPTYTSVITYTNGPLSLQQGANTITHFGRVGKKGSGVIKISGNAIGFITDNDATNAACLFSEIAPTYATGHQVGNIRRAYLCNTEVESVTATELVTNGTFDVDTAGWVANASGAISFNAGKLRITNGAANGAAIQGFSTVVGKTYKVSADFIKTTLSGVLSVTNIANGGNSFANVPASVTGNFGFNFVASAATTYVVPYINGGVAADVADFDNISVKEVIADRSYKAASANIFGTLVKSQVASAAQLVAYSNFSATNYISENYSADLDYGVGEWSVGAWVSAPVTLPVSNFPATGSELSVNGDFSSGTSNINPVSSTVSVTGGNLLITSAVDGGGPRAEITLTGLAVGALYAVTVRARAVGSFVSQKFDQWTFGSITPTYVTSTVFADYTFKVVATASSGLLRFYSGDNSGLTGNQIEVDYYTFKAVAPVVIADRSAAIGPSIKLGMDAAGKIVATAFDGTTTRTVTTPAAYNNGIYAKVRATYFATGKLGITVNGVEVVSATGTPLLTLSNAAATLTIGNSRLLDAPFPGSITLLKTGATVPTLEQATWMYEQEKQMFRDGAQITLPAATAVTDLSYDESQDKWVALQAGYESSFTGLIRTSAAVPSAGSFSRVVAGSGVKALARTTTSPGVDIVIPAYGMREELVRRAEAAAKASKTLTVFDFDAIAAQVDFVLPLGWTATEVLSAGSSKREGATKDFVRLFDGFRETIRFAVAPGAAAWVQITARKE